MYFIVSNRLTRIKRASVSVYTATAPIFPELDCLAAPGQAYGPIYGPKRFSNVGKLGTNNWVIRADNLGQANQS